MWSTEHRGGVASVLNAQQRVLFPVEAGASDTTARQLTRALLAGSCAGVALLAPDDERACRVVRAALHDACDRNPLLSRAHFAVVVETSAHWAADELLERAERLLEHLQLETLDLLLLRMQTLALPSEPDVYETKRAVLRLWAAALELQQRGRVAHLGVSDFSIQLTEFILRAHPCDPPVALALVLSLEPPLSPAAAANGTEAKTGGDTRLASAVAFAHGRGVDVIVRFPVRALDALSPAVRDRWSRLVHTIAHKHRGQRFEVVVAHEAGREPHPTQTQTQTQTMAGTPALQAGSW
ncbi:hypothetical protein PybrP1_004566 [[Pythium] brassicae (nom. inval.)]|nr:hypothetical protein PybrP1_004566 [[Pythium] brassicae (nom. inval.)]